MEENELFKGAAQSYARYRPGYSVAFFNRLVEYFALDKSKRVLDLGTGTGQIAIPISEYVQEVVAVDPDKEMLQEGETQAAKKDAKNIKWLNLRAEDISNDLGLFRATTMGASFHWMEQGLVLEKVYDLTENGGGIAIVAGTSTIINNKGKDEWKDVVWATVKEFLGEKRRAGNGYYKEPDSFDKIIARSKFSHLETFNDAWITEKSIEDVFGYLASTSFAAPRLFGDRLSEFQEKLRTRLLEANPSGNFIEHNILEAYLARK